MALALPGSPGGTIVSPRREETEDSITEFTGGDPVAGRQLRQALTVLAEEYAGTPLGRQITDVLAGRATMRELAGDPELATLAHRGMEQFQQEWAELSPAERAAAVAEVEDLAAREA